MASPSEMIELAKAQQAPNTLADVAMHFMQGASSGYDAGHAEALKNQEDPIVDDPLVPGHKAKLSVVAKILEVHAKMASIEEANNINALIKGQTMDKELNARNQTLGEMGTNALKASGVAGVDGKMDNTNQGKIQNMVAGVDPQNKRAGKMSISLKDGKPSISMDFGDSKKSTVEQMTAMKNYVEKGDPAPLAVAFPDGIPDWATKFMAQHADIKQKQKDIQDAKDKNEQDRMEENYKKSFMSVRGDPSIARTEAQRDASIIAYNTINSAMKEGRPLNQVEYFDTLGQLWKARTGSSPTDQSLRDVDAKTFKGDIGKVLTYFTGKPKGATTQDNMKALAKFTADSGLQADKLHAGYMKSRLKPPSRLAPDRVANVEANRGLSFQEATGYQPEKITVSNGQETLMIDPADVADAEKDGYKQL